MVAGMAPPSLRVAMLAAAIRSRCPVCPQCGQVKFRPAGLGTRRLHAGQVEDVPRSSTNRALGAAVLPPPPRPPLPPLRGTGGSGPGAALTVTQVLPALGPDRPPRHQHLLTPGPRYRVGVDNAEVHPRDPGRVGPVPSG
jgi:hypothetical protein